MKLTQNFILFSFACLAGAASAADLLAGRMLADFDCPASADDAQIAKTFTLTNGELVANGAHPLILVTCESFGDFTASVEVMYESASFGDGGFVFHADGAARGTGVEFQLKTTNVGDLWAYPGTTFAKQGEATPVERGRYECQPRLRKVEIRPSEWNCLQIVSTNGTVSCSWNGEVVNRCRVPSDACGRFGFQTQPYPQGRVTIHFRNLQVEGTPRTVSDTMDDATYLRHKFRQDVTDRSTGLPVPRLKRELQRLVAEGTAVNEDWRITKAKCFATLVNRQAIDVSPHDWFPAIAVWNRNDRPMNQVVWGRAGKVNVQKLPESIRKEWHAGNAAGIWNMWQDFDHSVPDWRVILKLGFPRMKTRLETYAVKGDPFYESLAIAMDAVLSGIDRFIVQGRKRLAEGDSERLKKEIASLERLRKGPPETAYDMLMFVWIYFFDSEHLDAFQCRSLSELDVFLTPYYEADLAAGRTTEAEFREQLKHFLWQWGSINNYWNQPAGLGGTNPDGSSAYNHVTKIVLDVVDECNLPTPKILVKVATNTPDWAMAKLMDMARRHRSVSFIGEQPAARALKKWLHASDEDCRTMVVRGCYEFGLRDAVNTTGVGHVNFLKQVELMLAAAKDGSYQAATFEDFKRDYLKRLADVTARCRGVAFEFEKVLADVNPANMMTLATENALKTRRDGFATGCPRGNNSTILAVGPGTAVDALMAIKELVYEKKELTLAELGAIMAANWEGHEPLRLRMFRSKRKWGNNDPEANALGRELLDTFASQLNGFPNARGGQFLASGHCARQFIELGKKTGATPDGRKAGMEMSKNLSPTMGADTEGATALVATLGSSSVEVLPGDYPLDVMLHPSSVSGEKGLDVMKTLVQTFHANGGSVVQFTVFSVEELRDAQRHPEKYENLQVRVCGWNVRWNDMPKSEQDAYIRRAENILQ